MLRRFWTISNFFSSLRIVLIVPVSYCYIAGFPHHRLWTVMLLLAAIGTDFLDGYCARLWHQVTDWGKIIDPLADKIAKLIPLGAQGFPMTIKKAMKEVPELKEMYDSSKDTKTIIEMAQKIEGCARHISVHAAGVVIAPTPLTNYVPLQFDPKGEGKIITQYDMHSVGEDGIGLLKFDFLGIKNLSILADAVDRVKKI